MDIPIRFKFFDKLKLYQDYLKEDSMLEKTKSEYWLCEKAIMLWAYSDDHQHLGVPLSVVTFVHKSKEILEGARRIDSSNKKAIRWVGENIDNKEAMLRVVENLIILELATDLKPQQERVNPKDYSREVTVNLKGFLLGELLFETYENSGFWSRNFRKYKLALFVFYATFIVLFLTVYLVFLEQLFRLIKPESFVAIGAYIGKFLGYSWWSTVTTCFLIYLGLRRVWKRL
ncbi:hypothetical protein ISS85_05090 [Candidatus Microgenomates bacterium]|nr:hypothetical protein [Candidatus Microgenomates bacterium]